MEKATVEITKEEAALLPLLYKVPMSATLESAPQMMKHKLIVDGLIEKVKKAFAGPAVNPPTADGENKPKRKRH